MDAGWLSAFIAGLGEVEFMSLRKPYRSVDEQLRILRSRGMAVDAGAGHVLRREAIIRSSMATRICFSTERHA